MKMKVILNRYGISLRGRGNNGRKRVEDASAFHNERA